MRKWINIAESIILVAMLVFVIDFHKYYTQPICIANGHMPVGATWDGNKLVSDESNFIKSVTYRIDYDENNNVEINYYYDPESVLVRIDPQSVLLEKILRDTGKSIEDVKMGMLEYNNFNEFTDILLTDAQSVVHFIDCQTKEIEVKQNDILVFWDGIESNNKYIANHKTDIGTKTDKFDENSYDTICQGDRFYRMKFYRANQKGSDDIKFDFTSEDGLLAKSTTTVIVK